MGKRYNILRFMGGVFSVLGVLSFIMLAFAMYQILTTSTSVSRAGVAGIAYLLPSIGLFLFFFSMGFLLLALGELVELLLSLEENARYTADYLRQRSKPKQE